MEKAGSILDRLMSKMGIKARIEQEKVLVLWKEAVGEGIARRARATSIRGGTLFVTVQDSIWMQEISLLKEGIIRQLNSLIGGEIVKDLVFRIGNVDRRHQDGI